MFSERFRTGSFIKSFCLSHKYDFRFNRLWARNNSIPGAL